MKEIQLLQGDIDRKNIELSKLYQENDQYKKEIANAKQVAKAEQITISEMGTRINDLISKLKTKEAEQQNGIENLGHIIDSQKEQIKDLEREALKSEKNMTFLEIEKNKEVQEMENNIVELENQIKHMLSKLRDTEAELNETKSR
jgi:predicted  nucleic acid-binding Zn-ribbon protein